jgi:hypothetical protein
MLLKPGISQATGGKIPASVKHSIILGLMVEHLKRGFFVFFFLCTLFNLLYLPPLRFHCVGGCCDRTQNCCDVGIDSQMLSTVNSKPGQISFTLRQISSTLRQISSTLGQISPKLGQISSKFCKISSTLRQISSTIGQISSTLVQISSTLGKISSTLGQISSTLGKISPTYGQISSTFTVKVDYKLFFKESQRRT